MGRKSVDLPEGVEVVGKSVRIRFTWKHRRCETLACAPTAAGIAQAASLRTQVKQLIKDMKKTIPLVESSIFSSAQKVSLGAVLGWRMRDEGPFTSFLDVYGQDEG